jgi:peroxiredoxin
MIVPDAYDVASKLEGAAIPSVRLGSGEAAPVDLAQYASLYSLVIYSFPGIAASRDDGPDRQMHNAFSHCCAELDAKGYRIFGVSGQFEGAQRELIGIARLRHRLLSDPALRFAEALTLPTIEIKGEECYERLILITSGGVVRKAFFPISRPERSAHQVLTWMLLHGI